MFYIEPRLSIKEGKSKKKRVCKSLIYKLLTSGETGIRTPGSVTFNGFQDRRNRPLCHLSKTTWLSSAFC